MDNSQGTSRESSQENFESQKTPKKNPRTPKKNVSTPRKQKCSKIDTRGMKALAFFDEVGVREEDGVAKLFYDCQLCHRELVGSNPSNLASHLYHKHRSIYVEHIGDVDEPIQVKRLKLIQNCVSIIALGGRPFASLMDLGFQEIVAKQLKEFELAGHPLNLKQECQPDIHEYLHRAADLVREEIKQKIKGRAISIQLDMATRLGRSVFGIDLQYVNDSNITIHNIGMMVLDKAHTAENLLHTYRKCLQLYDIKRTQVVSISADNGKNIQKMIRLEKAESADGPPPKKRAALDYEVADLYEPSQQTNAEIIDILNTEEPSDDDAIDMIFEECDIDLDNLDSSEQSVTILRQTMQQISTEHGHDSFDLSGIRCAVHTLQLVVKDALAALPQETKNIILLCRRVAKILRLESTKYYIEGTGLVLKKPKLDVETRWGSTYVMLVEVTNLQKIIEHIAVKAKRKKKYSEFSLLLQNWRILKEIIYILKIPYDATVALQNRKLTLSDTFGVWLQVKLHLKKIVEAKVSKADLDVKLLEGITNRNDHIFDHPAMKAAIYLDPRYRSAITQNTDNVDDATAFIVEMKQRLNHLKDQVVANETIRVDDGDLDDSIGVRFDAEAAINEYLGTNQTNLNSISDFNAELDAFNPPVMGIKESVLQYWNGPSNDYHLLRDVANAIFAIPPTETEVERDFSALKFIFSDLRGGLLNKTLENILCIHLNKELYLEVNQSEIIKLEESLNK